MLLNAQTTYYYRLTKTEIDGKTSTDVSGGQFISFNGKVCYESDKKGNQVNSSRMNYKYTENGIKVYSGSAYWGNNTIFFFTEDQSRMSVKTSGGAKYVYERAAAPSEALTCSLIREKQSDGTVIPQPVIPIIGGSTGGNDPKKLPEKNQPQVRTKCPNCTNGRRLYEKSISVPTFGLKVNMKACSECGKTYDANSTAHWHDRCNTCHGSGYLD